MTTEFRASAPPSLLTAAAVVALEGLALVVLGVLEIASLTGGRLTMGLTTALFFALFGVLLMASGWLIVRGQTWARGPILLAQLIALGLAWNLRGGDTILISLSVGVVALVVLGAMLHPASIAALNDLDEPG